jgi:hypothetical protein
VRHRLRHHVASRRQTRDPVADRRDLIDVGAEPGWRQPRSRSPTFKNGKWGWSTPPGR